MKLVIANITSNYIAEAKISVRIICGVVELVRQKVVFFSTDNC